MTLGEDQARMVLRTCPNCRMVWTYTVDEELARKCEFAEAGNFKLRRMLLEALPFIDGHTEESRGLRQAIENMLRESPGL